MSKKGKKYMDKGQAQQGFWDYEVSQQKVTRRRKFLRQMQEVIPWKELEEECVRAGYIGVREIAHRYRFGHY